MFRFAKRATSFRGLIGARTIATVPSGSQTTSDSSKYSHLVFVAAGMIGAVGVCGMDTSHCDNKLTLAKKEIEQLIEKDESK
jgi:hypothetical protein